MNDKHESMSPARHIGILLRDLRKQRKLTGIELGIMAGLSQSKIAKIENGYSAMPSSSEIENILKILDAPKTIRQRIALLMRDPDRSDRLPPSFKFHTDYQSAIKYESPASDIKCFCINMVPSILQTEEFRKALLQIHGVEGKKVSSAMQTLIRRQDSLWDDSKAFHYIVPETVLYTAIGGGSAQIAQLDRLERLIGTSNSLRLGIIPTESGLSVFETGSFAIFDESLVVMVSGSFEIEAREQDSIFQHLNAFDEFEQKAVYGNEAVGLIRKAIDYVGG